MAIEIRVPTLGESVSEATVGQWFKKVGDYVNADEPLVELETDKVTVEVPSPVSGILAAITVERGTTVAVGTALGAIREGAAQAAAPVAAPPAPAWAPPAPPAAQPVPAPVHAAPVAQAPVVQAPVVQAPVSPPRAAPAPAPVATQPAHAPAPTHINGGMQPGPAARKALAEASLIADDVDGSGRRGQVLKSDVAAANAAPRAPAPAPMAAPVAPPQPSPQPARAAPVAAAPAPVPLAPVAAPPAPAAQAPRPSAPAPAAQSAAIVPVAATPMPAPTSNAPLPVPSQQLRVPSTASDADREERVKMSRLRQTIARRLKDAQNTAAMLTTFNDVDMSAVMGMRTQYKDLFEKRHGVKLGFMGFFVKACLQALKEIPSVNAEIDGGDIIYKNYYHIGVAVGTDKGLVVPVVREADRMSVAEIEARIAGYGKKARDGKLSIDDMQGGTFTITNGGVYGSLMSTPILNAPQSGILGMHRIEDRAVVRKGEIVIRPMMTLALSYDHRIVDGKEAVTFLVRVKECLEDPQRFILEL